MAISCGVKPECSACRSTINWRISAGDCAQARRVSAHARWETGSPCHTAQTGLPGSAGCVHSSRFLWRARPPSVQTGASGAIFIPLLLRPERLLLNLLPVMGRFSAFATATGHGAHLTKENGFAGSVAHTLALLQRMEVKRPEFSLFGLQGNLNFHECLLRKLRFFPQ